MTVECEAKGKTFPLPAPFAIASVTWGCGPDSQSHFVQVRAVTRLRPESHLKGPQYAWRARRSARAAPPASRSHGGAGQRAGSSRQGGRFDRRQHGGGGPVSYTHLTL